MRTRGAGAVVGAGLGDAVALLLRRIGGHRADGEDGAEGGSHEDLLVHEGLLEWLMRAEVWHLRLSATARDPYIAWRKIWPGCGRRWQASPCAQPQDPHARQGRVTGLER